MTDQTETNKKRPGLTQIAGSYRRMITLAKPEWKFLALGTLFLMVGSGTTLVAPWAIGKIIDSAGSGGMADIDRMAILMLIIFVIQGAAVFCRYFLFTMAGNRVVVHLRVKIFDNLMKQEIGFFDQRKTGELLSRLASDTTVLQNAVSVNVSMALRYGVTSVGGIALLIYSSPVLAAMMLLILPVVVVAMLFYSRKLRLISRKVQDALAKAAEIAEETISGVRTVRSFAREKMEVKRYSSAIFDALEAIRRRIVGMGLFQAGMSFAGYGTVALVFWYGGKLVVSGEMTTGELTAFILYTFTVAFSLGALGSLWADLVSATGAAERIFELMDRQPEVDTRDGETLAEIRGEIRFEQVSFAYPSRPDVSALREVSFTVDPGEVVALVGPSGSGKSTIASLIPRFYDPTTGMILVDGKPLTRLDPDWLRQQIGIVSQEPMLFSSSIGENIAYGVDGAKKEHIVAAAKVANAHEFIEDFPEGYETEVGERGVRLSGGQKQRVAIARAVLKNPRILILDEATSALDAESEFLVQQALDRLMKERTTLVIAHRLSTVRDADRVLVLDKGSVAELGTHEELMGDSEGMYRKLVERQFVHHG